MRSMTIPIYRWRSSASSPMYSPALSIKDGKFFTERIPTREKIFALELRKWRMTATSILHGSLLVITSYKFRNKGRPDGYEAESNPLWVNFNRSFPLRAKVDLPSRVESFWPHGSHISGMGNECQVSSEREELVVYKCREMYQHLQDISDLVDGSHSETMGLEFEYGLNEDEGDQFLSNQPLELEFIESLQKTADSLAHEEFSIQSPSEDAVTITSNPTSMALEPDLQYIIHITFPHEHLGLELMLIAQAFTAVIVDNLPQGKTISFEFFSADQPLPVILASHRNLINSRPEFAIGALHQGSRNFPQARHHHDVEVPSHREPYRIFFVVLDRPDFLTGPDVLFFLADGNEMTDEAMKVYVDSGLSGDKLGGYALYQVWRSAGMTEVAQRLAMISKCTHLASNES